MPSLKEIRNKISSVKSTKRIMQAMKMIATVKYAKTQVMIGSYRPYYDAYKKIISTLSKMSTKNGEKYLKSRDEDNDLLIIISSDRGLCGSYNTSLFRKIDKDDKTFHGKIYIGKKGKDYFKDKGYLEEDISFTEKNLLILLGNLFFDICLVIREKSDLLINFFFIKDLTVSGTILFSAQSPPPITLPERAVTI